jgi:hypothetical protein
MRGGSLQPTLQSVFLGWPAAAANLAVVQAVFAFTLQHYLFCDPLVTYCRFSPLATTDASYNVAKGKSNSRRGIGRLTNPSIELLEGGFDRGASWPKRKLLPRRPTGDCAP